MGAPEKYLTEQVLVRMHKDERAAWEAKSVECGLPLNILVRRIVGHALGILPRVEEIDRLVQEGKLARAAGARVAAAARAAAIAAGEEVPPAKPRARRAKDAPKPKRAPRAPKAPKGDASAMRRAS